MTAYSWVLIIAMYSPGGDFISQDIVKLDSRRTCEAIKKQLPSLDHPMHVQHKGLCVTRDHWEGKKQMPGVAYD
jgi:hypothetical protein